MKKETINDLMPLTTDWNAERLKTLKELMPDLFTNEGFLDENELRKLVNPESLKETERYEFRWFGKSQAKRNAFTPTDASLVYDEARSVSPEESENLIIEGDNLEVLKLLSLAYREKIKCIYIDPPYNTGKDFVYSDNFNEDRKPYWEQTDVTEKGVKIDTNTEAGGRFHSNWLDMMFPRLLLARQLLSKDGVIFIQIDDNEIDNLKKVCDEVFGEENFVNIICVKMSHLSGMKMSHKEKKLPKIKEYLILYAKNKELFTLKPVFVKSTWSEVFDRYDYFVHKSKKEDCSNWHIERLSNVIQANNLTSEIEIESFKINNADKIFRTAVNDSLHNIPKNDYFQEITTKTGLHRFVYKGEEVLFASNKIVEIDGKKVPAQNLGDIWLDIGINNLHKEGDVPFPNGKKPIKLLKRILELSMDSSDLVLDFFGGSGTTGQAVMELNEEDGGNRRFILVQLPELTDEKSEAYKAGFKKISDITIERNKRVIEKLQAEKQAANPELFEEGKADPKNLSFRVFELAKSYFPRTEWSPNPELSEDENVAALKEYIRVKEAQQNLGFEQDRLLTEILLKKGFMLNYKTEKDARFTANVVLAVTDGTSNALICLDEKLKDETVEFLKNNATEKFICLERSLDTTKKWNLHHYLGEKFVAF